VARCIPPDAAVLGAVICGFACSAGLSAAGCYTDAALLSTPHQNDSTTLRILPPESADMHAHHDKQRHSRKMYFWAIYVAGCIHRSRAANRAG
jgi:hypothetical protein